MQHFSRTTRLLLLAAIYLFPLKATAQDSLAFGDKEWINNGLMGKIYFLPEGIQHLPDFDTLQPRGTLYTTRIDVPVRNWSSGFPGVPDRNEWFGIVYTGQFNVKKPGRYIFRLLSDDGSKLFIDNKLLIDNDGQHPPASRLGEVTLDKDRHSIRLEYFQGPAMQIALQLFSTLGNENEQVFSREQFTFITPPLKKNWTPWLIYAGAGLILIIILLIWWRRKKKENR